MGKVSLVGAMTAVERAVYPYSATARGVGAFYNRWERHENQAKLHESMAKELARQGDPDAAWHRRHAAGIREFLRRTPQHLVMSGLAEYEYGDDEKAMVGKALLGYTRSGKEVHTDISPRDYGAGFTAADHGDAARLHQRHAFSPGVRGTWLQRLHENAAADHHLRSDFRVMKTRDAAGFEVYSDETKQRWERQGYPPTKVVRGVTLYHHFEPDGKGGGTHSYITVPEDEKAMEKAQAYITGRLPSGRTTDTRIEGQRFQHLHDAVERDDDRGAGAFRSFYPYYSAEDHMAASRVHHQRAKLFEGVANNHRMAGADPYEITPTIAAHRRFAQGHEAAAASLHQGAAKSMQTYISTGDLIKGFSAAEDDLFEPGEHAEFAAQHRQREAYYRRLGAHQLADAHAKEAERHEARAGVAVEASMFKAFAVPGSKPQTPFKSGSKGYFDPPEQSNFNRERNRRPSGLPREGKRLRRYQPGRPVRPKFASMVIFQHALEEKAKLLQDVIRGIEKTYEEEEISRGGPIKPHSLTPKDRKTIREGIPGYASGHYGKGDGVSFGKDGLLKFRHSFFYSHGHTSEKHAQAVQEKLRSLGYDSDIHSHHEHWASWPKTSYWQANLHNVRPASKGE